MQGNGVAAVAAAMLALTTAAARETLTWEAFALAGPGRQVLGGGTRTYSPAKDILVEERAPSRAGSPSWAKWLRLDDTFALAASVGRDPRLTGFGIWIARRGEDDGFSWEWFDHEDGAVFSRRQGSGRVAVVTRKGDGYEELESIEFLDDTTLRYLDDMSKPPGTHTHEVVIRKGSVFKVAP